VIKKQHDLPFIEKIPSSSACKKKSILLVALLLTLASPAYSADQPVLKAVTVIDNYPYNFMEDGQVRGLGFDVASALAERIGYRLSVEVQPSTRALKTSETEPSVLIFSIFRTPDRERRYYWIGPIAESEIWLYKLKSRSDIDVHSLADAKRYLVGLTADDAPRPVLEKLGIKVDTAPSDLSNCRKFKMGRFDLVPVEANGIKEFFSICELPLDQVEKLVKLPITYSVYIGIGKSTPPYIAHRLQVEMETMKKDQTLHRLGSKWNVN